MEYVPRTTPLATVRVVLFLARNCMNRSRAPASAGSLEAPSRSFRVDVALWHSRPRELKIAWKPGRCGHLRRHLLLKYLRELQTKSFSPCSRVGRAQVCRPVLPSPSRRSSHTAQKPRSFFESLPPGKTHCANAHLWGANLSGDEAPALPPFRPWDLQN